MGEVVKECYNCGRSLLKGGKAPATRKFFCDHICRDEYHGRRPKERATMSGWVADRPGQKRKVALLVTIELEQDFEALSGYNPVMALVDAKNKELVARLLHALFDAQIYGYKCKVTVSDGGPV